MAALANSTADRIAFDKGAIMRRAYEAGRFAFQLCRDLAERRRQLSLWLRKAWAEAKAEAYRLRQYAEAEAAAKAALAVREANAAALAASFGSEPAAIRRAIEAEHYRERFNFAHVAILTTALRHAGA